MRNVGFKIDVTWLEFGYSETLNSFFSTVCYNLENKEWGSKFPITMNSLYYDEEFGIKYEDIEEFQKEIEMIQNKLSKLKPENAIWSFEDKIYEIPNNKQNLNYEAKNLVDFYQEIFIICDKALEFMKVFESNCKIEVEKN